MCGTCTYPNPLPACYAKPAAPVAACATGVADKLACTTACGPPCSTMMTGKPVDCVCSPALKWACATQWWM